MTVVVRQAVKILCIGGRVSSRRTRYFLLREKKVPKESACLAPVNVIVVALLRNTGAHQLAALKQGFAYFQYYLRYTLSVLIEQKGFSGFCGRYPFCRERVTQQIADKCT